MSDDSLHLAALRPDDKNARRHTPRNVGMIVNALQEVGAARSIVIDENNRVLAGNATIDAAAQAGIENVRVIETDGNTIVAVRRRNLTEEQKRRLALYDNRTAELAEWDTDVLEGLAEDGLDLGDFWFDDELDALLGLEDTEAQEIADAASIYTQKTPSPIYTPTGERPPLSALSDTSHYEQLLQAIEDADIPADVREFLKLAASRHIVFNYRNIAEYYAHADPTVQRLMEDSALIIIDFQRAIELGYVKLSSRISELLEDQLGDIDE